MSPLSAWSHSSLPCHYNNLVFTNLLFQEKRKDSPAIETTDSKYIPRSNTNEGVWLFTIATDSRTRSSGLQWKEEQGLHTIKWQSHHTDEPLKPQFKSDPSYLQIALQHCKHAFDLICAILTLYSTLLSRCYVSSERWRGWEWLYFEMCALLFGSLSTISIWSCILYLKPKQKSPFIPSMCTNTT